MEEIKSFWCPFTNDECREDCALNSQGEIDNGCAFRIIAEHFVGGSIGVKTYGGETIAVTTDSIHTNGGFNVRVV